MWTPAATPLAELVRVAGRRWATEEAFQAGKGLAGLDEHQLRRWTCGRRWTVLAMLAHAVLAVTAATNRLPTAATDTPIMTCAEVHHLFATLILIPVRALNHVLNWSRYRRTSAAKARASHYARQADTAT